MAALERWENGRAGNRVRPARGRSPIRASACARCSSWWPTRSSRTSSIRELLKALDHPARAAGDRPRFRAPAGVPHRIVPPGRPEPHRCASSRAAGRMRPMSASCSCNLQLHQPRMQHDEFEAYVEHVMDDADPRRMKRVQRRRRCGYPRNRPRTRRLRCERIRPNIIGKPTPKRHSLRNGSQLDALNQWVDEVARLTQPDASTGATAATANTTS